MNNMYDGELSRTDTEKYYYFWVMKIKGGIYFVLIIAGLITMFFGDQMMRKEYALAIGIVLLMFGLYKVSRSWQRDQSDDLQD